MIIHHFIISASSSSFNIKKQRRDWPPESENKIFSNSGASPLNGAFGAKPAILWIVGLANDIGDP